MDKTRIDNKRLAPNCVLEEAICKMQSEKEEELNCFEKAAVSHLQQKDDTGDDTDDSLDASSTASSLVNVKKSLKEEVASNERKASQKGTCPSVPIVILFWLLLQKQNISFPWQSMFCQTTGPT